MYFYFIRTMYEFAGIDNIMGKAHWSIVHHN